MRFDEIGAFVTSAARGIGKHITRVYAKPRLAHPMSMLKGAHGTNVASRSAGPTRRRMLAGMSALPLMAVAAALPVATRARAAAAGLPSAIRNLDTAAMALFEAAESGHWPAAKRALDRARAAATAAAGMESAYVDAGGHLWRFFEARNDLGADLIEARTALSVKDRRWLVSSADHIAQRAGELSQPFARGSNAVAPRIETLLFLARRMRRALVWQDRPGLRTARDDFTRLWQATRTQLAGIPADKVSALDDALKRLSESSSRSGLVALYQAVRALKE